MIGLEAGPLETLVGVRLLTADADGDIHFDLDLEAPTGGALPLGVQITPNLADIAVTNRSPAVGDVSAFLAPISSAQVLQ